MPASERSVLMARAVVFDIGGVLCLTPATHWEAHWARSLRMTEADLTAALREVGVAGTLGLMTLSEAEAAISCCLGLTPQAAAALMADVWTEYLGVPNAPLIAYLDSLRPRYLTALLSNSFVGAREREQVAYGFGSRCDVIVYSHEVGLQKPDLAIYSLVEKRLGVEASEIVFVDDVDENVAAAREAGWTAIQFIDSEQALRGLAEALAGV